MKSTLGIGFGRDNKWYAGVDYTFQKALSYEGSIYENDFMGSLQGESREFVIVDLENLFQSVGLTLGREKESIKRKVERLIWEDLALRAEETENAKLVFEKNQLFYNSKGL